MLINRLLVCSLVTLIITSCTSVSKQFDITASELKMTRQIVMGSRFQHVLYTKAGSITKTLHIYLGGDGTPWVAGRPSNDPTPSNPLMLRLMALDKSPAIYLGRPCYHGATTLGNCSSRFWLEQRYSEEIVVSLATVVKELLEQGRYEKISWFGHSGGGALAVLLAAKFPQTTASIVTISANLDLDAWAVYNGHDYLSGSLNPAALPPFPPSISQRHYAGDKDIIVPATLMSNAATQLGSELIIIKNYDHICCWELIWSSILENQVNQ